MGAVEGIIDAVSYTSTVIPASVGNGFRYGYKDLTTGYPVLSDKEKFKPFGFSFEGGFKQETPYYGTNNTISPQEGARIIKGTSTIIMPPLIAPQEVLIPGLIFKTGIPYYLENQ